MNNFSCKLKIQSDSFLPLQLSFDLSSLDIGQGHQKWCVYVKLDKGYHHLNFERSGFDTKLNKKNSCSDLRYRWLAGCFNTDQCCDLQDFHKSQKLHKVDK